MEEKESFFFFFFPVVFDCIHVEVMRKFSVHGLGSTEVTRNFVCLPKIAVAIAQVVDKDGGMNWN